MALVVVTDPFSQSANSYVSVAEVTDYVTTRVPDSSVAAAWSALTADQKAMYVVNATRSVDAACDWKGYPYYKDQKLKWPRCEVIVDTWLLLSTVVPSSVKEATCEMALWAMTNGGQISVGQNAAFDSIKVGPINIDFNEQVGGSADKYYPDIVAILLRELGTMVNPDLPESGRIKTAKLHRA